MDRILLVDDDRVTNMLHQRQLLRNGLARSVDIATDGQSALDYLQERARKNAPQPELILLDINMPRMSGFEFLDAYSHLPAEMIRNQQITMVSTSTLRTDRARAEQNSLVSTYETKPLSENDMRRIVAGCAGSRQS